MIPVPSMPYDQKMLVRADDRHPDRPWWRHVGEDRHDKSYERRDGWHISDNGYMWHGFMPCDHPQHDFQRTWEEHHAVERLMARIDAEFPLPPPLLRPGQVWLLQQEQELALAVLRPVLGAVWWQRCTLGHPGEDTLYSRWEVGGHLLWAEEAASLLLQGQGFPPEVHFYTWLVHDPIDPPSAPWTGCRETP